jgi:hypothetical protein
MKTIELNQIIDSETIEKLVEKLKLEGLSYNGVTNIQNEIQLSFTNKFNYVINIYFLISPGADEYFIGFFIKSPQHLNPFHLNYYLINNSRKEDFMNLHFDDKDSFKSSLDLLFKILREDLAEVLNGTTWIPTDYDWRNI